MITLEIEDYCQECAEFNPTYTRMFTEDLNLDRHILTVVSCENAKKCRQLVRYLKKAGGESMNA